MCWSMRPTRQGWRTLREETCKCPVQPRRPREQTKNTHSRDSLRQWPRTSFPSSARTAAPPITSGRASATSCGEWNSLAEEDTTGVTTIPVSARSKRKGRTFNLESLTRPEPRCAAHCPRGWANSTASPAAASCAARCCLIGGDPGIGKSTLLTQATSLMARAGHRVVYISGEEAVAQVRLRARAFGPVRTPRCSSRPRPRSRTSSPRCPKARCRG